MTTTKHKTNNNKYCRICRKEGTVDELIRIEDVSKIYNPGENEVRALDQISVTIYRGEYVAIIGQSGSGKSTLMNILGCLDAPSQGNYYLNGTDSARKCRVATNL